MPPVDTDPHFLIHVPQKEDTLCFNIDEEPGVVLSLVQDPDTGMGDITDSARQRGAWTPRPSVYSCRQDSGSGRHFPQSMPQHHLEGLNLPPSLPSTCPRWHLLRGHVTGGGTQDPMLRRVHA